MERFQRSQRGAALVLAAAIALASSGATAEIYRWTDEHGKLHFAQDLNRVPARFRAQAEADAKAPKGRDPIQVYESSRSAPASRASSRSTATGAVKVHRIAVQRAGSSMRVDVRLNGSVTAPFLIDTGASDVVIPRSVAEQLGVSLNGPEVRTKAYSTANGIIEQIVLVLDTVELGGAKAKRVPASVSESMSIGLLGLSFFNHFHYQFDPARGIVTLSPNGLVDSGAIRGGRSKAQWRAEFLQLKGRIALVDQEIARTHPSHGRERARLAAMRDELERQYRRVEVEADEVRVPFSWRD